MDRAGGELEWPGEPLLHRLITSGCKVSLPSQIAVERAQYWVCADLVAWLRNCKGSTMAETL
jgi:hypothetical protein